MPSRHLLDREMQPLGEMPAISFESVGIEEVRAMMAANRPPLPPLPDDVQVYEARTPGRDGAPDVRLVVTAPKAAGRNRPGILHVHGGGYVLGSAEMTGPTRRHLRQPARRGGGLGRLSPGAGDATSGTGGGLLRRPGLAARRGRGPRRRSAAASW